MMEEFGKSKAKMIGGKVADKDKEGSFSGLTFKDVAGVDHIVEEFRYIIEVMKEFKEFQDTKDDKKRVNKKEKITEALEKVPKFNDPAMWAKAKEEFIEEFSGWPMKDIKQIKADIDLKSKQNARIAKLIKDIEDMPEGPQALRKLKKQPEPLSHSPHSRDGRRSPAGPRMVRQRA